MLALQLREEQVPGQGGGDRQEGPQATGLTPSSGPQLQLACPARGAATAPSVSTRQTGEASGGALGGPPGFCGLQPSSTLSQWWLSTKASHRLLAVLELYAMQLLFLGPGRMRPQRGGHLPVTPPCQANPPLPVSLFPFHRCRPKLSHRRVDLFFLWPCSHWG